MKPTLPKRQHRPPVVRRPKHKRSKPLRDAYDRGWRDGYRSGRQAAMDGEQG